MREIKFRGKRTDNGEMWYGDLSHHATGKVFIKNIKKGINGTFEVVFNTVGQFTGLYDKYGKEIYEGDIVRYTKGLYGYKSTYSTYNEIVKVYIDVGISVFEPFTSSDMIECEVIGNIHDNPELIKE